MAYVATIGFFDGVHLGHQCLINQVTSLGKERGMGSMLVTMDRHPREVLCDNYMPPLLTTLEEREALLRQTGVNHIEILHFDSKMSMMTAKDFMQEVLKEKLNVEVLIMGYDHRFGHGGGDMEEYINWGKECGIEVVKADKLDGMHVSSTEIRRLITAGKMLQATMLLGHPYTLIGEVVPGHQVGRKLGFPTANIKVEDSKLLPRDGVYAVKVCFSHFGMEDKPIPGMLNIGKRPTLDNGKEKTVEVHLLNFRGDLYDQRLKVEFVDFLREERQFEGLEQLKRQLEKDKREVISRLPLF